ncbi:MAG: thioredoxin domain-containing protein [Verrucomicrobiota bacterium]
MSNILSRENSLYLRQHAENPVTWYPWGEAAFSTARENDKPLLVSIGYSACHWCHVMAHESFEDPYIAGLMNKHFICVKVDREERPDVDQVYMEAVQMLQHHGGWPLNVFCLPDGRPFFGGTYFPPEDRGNGLIPWPQVLMRVADYYKRSRSELIENAVAIQKNILASNSSAGTGSAPGVWDKAYLVEAAEGICGNHDDQYGGFGNAPKFPPSMALNFLAALRGCDSLMEARADLVKRIDDVRRTTLRAMAHGGLFDQFGGGFARYSVDAHWLIPHFEKMLYDNALLVGAYVRGWLDFKDPLFKVIVEETVEWLEREMSSDSGAFYAALDADSEGSEGAYYVWKPEEVDAVLGPALSRQVRSAYNITNEGNFEDGCSNPALVEGDFTLRAQLTEARKALLEYRESERASPGLDTKISLAWNCLLIPNLAEAGFYLNRPEWLKRSSKALDFIWEQMSETVEGCVRLKSVYYEPSGPKVDGFLHDYALMSDACLRVAGKIALVDPDLCSRYLERGRACLDHALLLFKDLHAIGYFFTAEDVETPVARRKEWLDNATPSGNSVLMQALVAHYAISGKKEYADAVKEMLPVYSDYARKVASGVAHALEAITNHLHGIAVIKFREGAAIEPLRDLLAERASRPTFILPAKEVLSADYQLCLGTTCFPPQDSLEVLFAQTQTMQAESSNDVFYS